MPAILNPAARRINADVAGLTHVGGEPNPGAPVGYIPAETLHEVLPTEHGGLAGIFHDQLITNPAEILTRVDTGLVQPTGSILGRLGGLIPRPVSSQAPGPGTQQVAPTGIAPPGTSPANLWGPGGESGPAYPAPGSPVSTTMPNPIPTNLPAPVRDLRGYLARFGEFLGFRGGRPANG